MQREQQMAIRTESDNGLDPSSSQEAWEVVRSCICFVGQAHRQVDGLVQVSQDQLQGGLQSFSYEQLGELNGPGLRGETRQAQWCELCFCSQGREPGPSFTQLASSGSQIWWSSHKNPTLYVLHFPREQECVIFSVNIYLWQSTPRPTPALYPWLVGARTEPQIPI